MSGGVLIFILVVVVGAVLIHIESGRRQGGAGRSLADKFARKHTGTKLGMEATDAAGVLGILERNSALARKTGADANHGSWIEAGATSPVPYPEDETYAARYIGTHDERK